MKFYVCEICGQEIVITNDTGLPISCCGQEMQEILPKSTDSEYNEKHVPVYKITDNVCEITIGSTHHPMVEEHYIDWIILEAGDKVLGKKLHPNDNPCCKFCIDEKDEIKNIYCHCNIHGLWSLL